MSSFRVIVSLHLGMWFFKGLYFNSCIHLAPFGRFEGNEKGHGVRQVLIEAESIYLWYGCVEYTRPTIKFYANPFSSRPIFYFRAKITPVLPLLFYTYFLRAVDSFPFMSFNLRIGTRWWLMDQRKIKYRTLISTESTKEFALKNIILFNK